MKKKTVQEMTDDELRKVVFNELGYVSGAIIELWRRYEELKGEWYARAENI
jgi:hypothetical protein